MDMMNLKIFCTKHCPYKSNEDKKNMEPCISCPVETFIDMVADDIDDHTQYEGAGAWFLAEEGEGE